MIDIQEYMKENPFVSREKKSKLLKFEQEIKGLREAGATYAYIQQFLKKQNIKVSIENIRQFLLKMEAKTAQPENPTDELESKPIVKNLKTRQKAEKIVEKQTVENEESDENDKDSKTYSSQVENYVRPKWAKVDIKDLI